MSYYNWFISISFKIDTGGLNYFLFEEAVFNFFGSISEHGNIFNSSSVLYSAADKLLNKYTKNFSATRLFAFATLLVLENSQFFLH